MDTQARLQIEARQRADQQYRQVLEHDRQMAIRAKQELEEKRARVAEFERRKTEEARIKYELEQKVVAKKQQAFEAQREQELLRYRELEMEINQHSIAIADAFREIQKLTNLPTQTRVGNKRYFPKINLNQYNHVRNSASLPFVHSGGGNLSIWTTKQIHQIDPVESTQNR